MFLDISGLDFWTVCHVFHLKTFAVALAVQDVFQLKMSGFSVCTVSHFTVLVKAREKGQMSKMAAIYFMYADSCYFIYAGSCYFMYAESRYFISMLTADEAGPRSGRNVEATRSRLFYLCFIYAESRIWS